MRRLHRFLTIAGYVRTVFYAYAMYWIVAMVEWLSLFDGVRTMPALAMAGAFAAPYLIRKPLVRAAERLLPAITVTWWIWFIVMQAVVMSEPEKHLTIDETYRLYFVATLFLAGLLGCYFWMVSDEGFGRTPPAPREPAPGDPSAA